MQTARRTWIYIKDRNAKHTNESERGGRRTHRNNDDGHNFTQLLFNSISWHRFRAKLSLDTYFLMKRFSFKIFLKRKTAFWWGITDFK